MSRRAKAIMLGAVTSILAYVLPILAWGYIANERIGTLLFTAGIALSMPGFFVMKLFGLQAYVLRLLVPLVTNGALYAVIWFGILKSRNRTATQAEPPVPEQRQT